MQCIEHVSALNMQSLSLTSKRACSFFFLFFFKYLSSIRALLKLFSIAAPFSRDKTCDVHFYRICAFNRCTQSNLRSHVSVQRRLDESRVPLEDGISIRKSILNSIRINSNPTAESEKPNQQIRYTLRWAEFYSSDKYGGMLDIRPG